MMKIAIIDDKAGNRNILKEKLSCHPEFNITLVAENGKDFLEKLRSLADDMIPDVALMDLEMPEMDGVKSIALGAAFFPTIKFVVLTIFDDEEKIFRAIKAGACGYLLKEENSDTIASMLNHMHETGVGPISPGIAHKILQSMQKKSIEEHAGSPLKSIASNFDLTEREQEILQLLVQGLLYKEIGAKLDISPNTAKKHVMNIYQKLHINSRAQAMYLIYDKGLL
ncbi:MAG TPA: response regulator transcription factor [Ferruginibacter sp.]|nr:DNA-binding response regulator [Chitinophagaceae bacterium]HML56920.1 response regulator transcription factor [Ferruginibacter sp.]HRN92099.1 response regulator transcription factor [Ferruginibacter sp.]HRO06675.1 response regulator transcription factor [Ferruginibacter sp.]HRO97076.1 response regulator transcription factor [Ferruginibacter sp.]